MGLMATEMTTSADYCNCLKCREARGGWACHTCGAKHLTQKEASVHSWDHLVYVETVKMCEAE